MNCKTFLLKILKSIILLKIIFNCYQALFCHLVLKRLILAEQLSMQRYTLDDFWIITLCNFRVVLRFLKELGLLNLSEQKLEINLII